MSATYRTLLTDPLQTPSKLPNGAAPSASNEAEGSNKGKGRAMEDDDGHGEEPHVKQESEREVRTDLSAFICIANR